MFAFALTAAGYQFASPTVTASSNELAVLLPESDGVVVLDSKRLVVEALPQILASNLPMLEKVNGEIDKIKTKTGLDLREFDQVAVGLKNKGTDKAEFDAVLLARGNVSVESLKGVAEIASRGNFRTVKYGSRDIHVFSPDELIKDNKPGKGSWIDTIVSKLFGDLSKEVAITAYDSKTVAFGSLERVKQTIGNSPRISNDILGLLDRKSGSLANGGMKVPTGMSQYLDLEDDELGNNLNSIRFLQGSLEVNDGVTSVSIAARTIETAQAEELAATVNAISGMFAGILKKNKSADKQVYGRMLESIAVTQVENEIFVDLTVPKSDLDVLIGKK